MGDIQNMGERKKRSVDKIDRMLISQLAPDARKGYPELAEALGRSEPVVHRRLRRLVEEGIITIATVVNPVALGYSTWVVLGIKVLPGRVDAVADQLASYRNVTNIELTTGRYDLLAWAIFRSPKDFFNFLTDAFATVSGAQYIEIMNVLKIPKISWGFSGPDKFTIDIGDPPQHLDGVDLKLMTQLERDGRQTISSLASILGISRSVVSKKVQALLDERIVRVVGVITREALGYTIRATILVRVDPSRISDVIHRLESMDRIKYLAVTSGSYNLMAMAIFRDNQELTGFLRKELGEIRGIVGHETLMAIKQIKMSFSLLASEDDDAGGSSRP